MNFKENSLILWTDDGPVLRTIPNITVLEGFVPTRARIEAEKAAAKEGADLALDMRRLLIGLYGLAGGPNVDRLTSADPGLGTIVSRYKIAARTAPTDKYTLTLGRLPVAFADWALEGLLNTRTVYLS